MHDLTATILNRCLNCAYSLAAYMRGLAQVCGVAAGLQTCSQCQKLIALLVKLNGLVQPHVRHPDVAVKVNCEAMWHQEQVLPPT